MGPTYIAKTRQDKMTDLWGMIDEDHTVSELPWERFYKIFTNDANGSFCQDSDEMKDGREKINHRQGVVA